MKIVHLTSVHPRNDIRVFYKECVSLANIDEFEVVLIVADGKGDTFENNVKILDVGCSKNRFFRIFYSTLLVFIKAVKEKSDIYHFHDPELIFWGYVLKIIGYKVVFDIHEFTYIQIKNKEWLPAMLREPISACYKFLESFFCRKFNLLVVPQEEMNAYYRKINDSVITAFNYPAERDLVSPNNMHSFSQRRYNLVYVGSISDERGFLNMINLMESLLKLDSKYKLFIAGIYTAEQKKCIENSIAKNSIELLGFLDRESIKNILVKCAWGLILFNNVGQYYMANALKMFEYMSVGQMLILPNFGDWVKVNEQYNIGLNVNVKDSDEIARHILLCDENQFNDFSRRNIALIYREFLWEKEVEKIANAYWSI